jgi:hypothetical protein
VPNESAPATTPSNGSLGGATSPNPEAPPNGSLSGGGAPVQGLLGSYCWYVSGVGSCVDGPDFTDSGPDLPVLTLTTTISHVHFALEGSYPFETWTANYIDADGNLVPLGGSAASFDPDAAGSPPAAAAEAVFDSPPAHDQSLVQVFVRFADGGDASYGWNVTVP